MSFCFCEYNTKSLPVAIFHKEDVPQWVLGLTENDLKMYSLGLPLERLTLVRVVCGTSSSKKPVTTICKNIEKKEVM